MKTVLLCVLCLVVVGCQVPERSPVYAPPSLKVWIEEGDYFKASDVLAGCAAWSVVGVTCRVAATEAEANTWVRSYESIEDCYAWGGTDGVILVNILHANHQGTALLSVVLAHEIGHVMGLGHLADGVVGVMSPSPVMPGAWLTVHDLREYEASR